MLKKKEAKQSRGKLFCRVNSTMAAADTTGSSVVSGALQCCASVVQYSRTFTPLNVPGLTWASLRSVCLVMEAVKLCNP